MPDQMVIKNFKKRSVHKKKDEMGRKIQPGEKTNILLVDDRQENLVALSAALECLGQNLVMARSGEEALEHVLNNEFSVIILDVAMPGMDGFETASLIREHERVRKTPIIFLTAFMRNDADISRGYSVGAADYLTKPFNSKILRFKVQVFVDLFNTRKALETQLEETAQLNSKLVKTNEELQVEITERKRAEEALQESEQRYATTLTSIGDAIIATDTEGRITLINTVAEELTGWSLTEAATQPMSQVFKIINEKTRQIVEDPVAKVLRHGKIIGLANHTILVRKDGAEIPIDDSAAPIKSHKGEIMGVVLVFRDITERKRAGEKIREQAILLEKAQDAIVLRDLEHRIIYWNNGAQHIYGWTKGEAIGKNAIELLYKDKDESTQLIEAKKSVIDKGDWTGEMHQLTKDGKEIIVESRWTLIRDNEGRPKSILTINVDITEKRIFEAHLLRAQRMESIGTLAGGIAHNLNNMLTPMTMSLRMLKEKSKDEQSQKILSILERNSERSAELIKQVLSFARGIEGERNPLQLVHIITEIEKVAKETFPRNIKIRTDISKDIFTISGDATQLHQVIMNLCVNARDAMPDGGILNISAENCFIDENYAWIQAEAKVGSYVVISVSDTGCGIPPEIIDRIFEPFFTTKEFGKGTGLGLSTALTIVKSHGGFIDVHSEVGSGTKFNIYLPAALTAQEESAEEQQSELVTGNGELILVAEDEDSIRDVTIATLEMYGYKVLAANDGAEAIAVYAQKMDEIKVVLMDIMMPVMDGQASILAIRRIKPQIKIIAASGLADKDKIMRIADMHVQAFLPKPYTAEKLLKTIHEVLSAK